MRDDISLLRRDVIRVVLIEDCHADALTVHAMLAQSRSEQFEFTHAGLIKHALDLIAKEDFDILLLNLNLPDGRGLSNLNQIQALAPGLPVIVLSNTHDEQLALHAVQAGAQDYLVKGWNDSQILIRAMRYAIERKRADERLAHLAHYDALTSLPNRTLFRDCMTRAFAHAQRHGHLIGLLFLDLDNFKSINDTLGHDVGDKLLQAVAHRVQNCARRTDTVARLGGDEFTVILEDISGTAAAAAVAQKIIDALSLSFMLDGHEVFVSASIGISFYPRCGDTPSSLLKSADMALYSAKEAGRGCYKFFDPNMQIAAAERLALVTALRHAVDRRQFVLHYQPQMDPRTHKMSGVEALVRWQHPERGLVPPNEFIHLLEDTGLIIPVGEWVLRTACMQHRAWRMAGLPSLRLSINLSARQIRQPQFVERVMDILRETSMSADELQLEVTESLLIDDIAETTAKLRTLQKSGIRISIDDFGTGYCSISYLKQFPLHEIKLDRSFIQNIDRRGNDAAIANAIIQLGHSMNMEVVAEGVESASQLAFLSEQGCDTIQGFYYGAPMSAQHLSSWLKRPYPSQPATIVPIR